jgi:hypothetical protein
MTNDATELRPAPHRPGSTLGRQEQPPAGAALPRRQLRELRDAVDAVRRRLCLEKARVTLGEILRACRYAGLDGDDRYDGAAVALIEAAQAAEAALTAYRNAAVDLAIVLNRIDPEPVGPTIYYPPRSDGWVGD